MRYSDFKNWLPPHVLPWVRRWLGRSIRFGGNFKNWAQAQSMSSGYAEGSILERIANSTRLVISGNAAYERDGVLFTTSDYSYPLVAMLLHAAATNKGRLNVIDFGGSLGSTYRQCRPLLQGVSAIHWRVVEQPNFVQLGRTEFETSELSFFETVEQASTICGEKQVLLFSSVLQYLEFPLGKLKGLDTTNFSHLIIDRTPISGEVENRLCVQKVPSHIYKASYPCWILSKPQLMNILLENWDMHADFPSLDGAWQTDDGMNIEFRGYCFLPKTSDHLIESSREVQSERQ